MEVDEYTSKANQQLTDRNLYKKLNEDPTRKYYDKARATIHFNCWKTYYKQRQNITIAYFTKNT